MNEKQIVEWAENADFEQLEQVAKNVYSIYADRRKNRVDMVRLEKAVENYYRDNGDKFKKATPFIESFLYDADSTTKVSGYDHRKHITDYAKKYFQ